MTGMSHLRKFTCKGIFHKAATAKIACVTPPTWLQPPCTKANVRQLASIPMRVGPTTPGRLQIVWPCCLSQYATAYSLPNPCLQPILGIRQYNLPPLLVLFELSCPLDLYTTIPSMCNIPLHHHISQVDNPHKP
jgi:hypothetical protein